MSKNMNSQINCANVERMTATQEVLELASDLKPKTPFGIAVILIASVLMIGGITLVGKGIWIKAKAELAQILLHQAFYRVRSTASLRSGELDSRAKSNIAKPWAWADIQPIAKLTAPRLGKSDIVLNNTSGEALAFGPGHLPGTPKPGDAGTSVFAAHRDTHFSWIKDLKDGDLLEVERSDGTIANFTVARAWIAPYDHSGINADSDNARLALSTCYPFNAKTPGKLRYIVEAEIVPGQMAIAEASDGPAQP